MDSNSKCGVECWKLVWSPGKAPKTLEANPEPGQTLQESALICLRPKSCWVHHRDQPVESEIHGWSEDRLFTSFHHRARLFQRFTKQSFDALNYHSNENIGLYIHWYIYIYIFFVGFNRGRSNTFWQSVARLLEPVPGLCLKSISIPARQALALSSSSRCRLARRRLKLHCEEALRLRFRFANLAGCLRGGLRHLPISRERHHAYGYGWIGNRYCDSANIGKQFDTKSFPFWLSWQPAILGSTCLRLLSVCLNLRLRSGPSCRTGTSRASLV